MRRRHYEVRSRQLYTNCGAGSGAARGLIRAAVGGVSVRKTSLTYVMTSPGALAHQTIVARPEKGTHSCPFADRVELYARLDERLHPMTRFFAAAAVTNSALVELCSLPCPGRWRFAIAYFGVIGSALEAINITWARRIEEGEIALENLDSSLITLEQLEVERLLRQSQSQHSHHRALQQINWLLQWAHSLTRPLRRCPSIRIYRQVLGQMRASLGRPLDFASLNDRIGIGHALTRSIRELGSFPGSKLQHRASASDG